MSLIIKLKIESISYTHSFSMNRPFILCPQVNYLNFDIHLIDFIYLNLFLGEDILNTGN